MSCTACDSPYAVITGSVYNGAIIKCNCCGQLFKYGKDKTVKVKAKITFEEEIKNGNKKENSR